MTEVVVVKNKAQASRIVSDLLVKSILKNPKLVLGLATGSTPLEVYKMLANSAKKQDIDVSGVRGFALDEYVALPKEHHESYHFVINSTVVQPVGLTPENVHVPNGDASTIQRAGAEYEELIKASGGVDIQILGIGTDGHIGFNEPGSSLASRTRIKTLTEQTRLDNAQFFSSIDEVPSHAITQGIGTILEARHLVLMAFGSTKAKAAANALEGPVCAFCPASALQLHPHATVFVDQDAATELQNIGYYKWSYGNKPSWQEL
ncbi:MAG: glucosamine-6-phosphate deaminase [Candidatus Ancillula trichonymphae]|jgi:glucosamine-6-phosphate deaminase|nr:glucosamine-6-phosphate deaminase [Candidatus Ancillula trichonymphae]